MLTKKFLLALVAVFIVIMVVDTIWFLGLFPAYVKSQAHEAENAIPALHAAAEFIYAFIFTAVFSMMSMENRILKRAVLFGILMGLAFALPQTLHEFADGEKNAGNIFFLTGNSITSGIFASIVAVFVMREKNKKAG